MRNKYIKLLLILFLFNVSVKESVSQTKIFTDSLNTIIDLTKNDTVKQKKLIELFHYQLIYNWTKAKETAEQGIKYFENRNPEFTVFWYIEIGKIYLDQGLFLSSVVSLKDAEDVCRKNKINTGEIMLYLAKIYYLKGKYEEGIKYYNIALSQFEKLKKTDKSRALKRIAKTYNKLGIVYELKGDFPESEKFYKKALNLRIKINDIQGIIDSYTSLGYFYNVIEDYDSAINYFNEGLKICLKQNGFKKYFNDLHLFRSTSYLKSGFINKSFFDIDTAKNYAQKYQIYDLARVYYYYAKTDYASADYKKLTEHLNKSLQYSDKFNLTSLKIAALDLFIKVNIKQNDYKNAFIHLKNKEEINKEMYSEKLFNVEKSFELETGKRKILELEQTSKKLEKKNQLYSFTIFFGILSFLLLTAMIIMSRKKNKKLSESKQYFETLFKNSPFGIAVITDTGKIQNINQSLLTILGSPSQNNTFELRNIYKIKSLSDSGFVNDFETVLKTGQVSEREYKYLSFWNKESFLRSVNVPLKNDAGEVSLVYSIIEDIGNRKKNEQTIYKLSEMVKQSTVSIVTTDKNGIIDYINPYFTKITGYSEKDAIGKSTNILKSGLTPKKTYKNLWETLNMKKTWKGEFINKTKSGKIYWESAIIFPLKNEKDEVINYIGFLEDISEEKMMQELLEKKELKLKELNETKDKFFSIIAHDLKNPFGAILSLSELLFQNFSKYDDKKKKDLIRVISEGAKNTYDLLENLLTWSRSQKGDIKFNPQKLLLNKLISDNINLLTDIAHRKKISVLFEAKEEIEIYADSNMLNFVVRNLLINAIKFTTQHGEIKFSTVKKKKNIQFCIEDTGIGMNSEQLNRLFKIDQTFSAKGTDNETGTGLGLILCKDFIDLHKGTIKAESKLGKGSTFCVEIPNNLSSK